jgi:hypothetical protein
MYNKAKGLNEEVVMGPDEVTIVRSACMIRAGWKLLSQRAMVHFVSQALMVATTT